MEYSREQYLYDKGFYEAMEDVMNFINALDSAEMPVQQARSAIYAFALERRPRRYGSASSWQ